MNDVWHLLETKLNEINSYNTFKKQIKQHFLLYTITNRPINIRHAIKHTSICIYIYCIIYSASVYCSPIIVKIQMYLQHI